jgi:hypothetical protein
MQLADAFANDLREESASQKRRLRSSVHPFSGRHRLQWELNTPACGYWFARPHASATLCLQELKFAPNGHALIGEQCGMAGWRCRLFDEVWLLSVSNNQ